MKYVIIVTVLSCCLILAYSSHLKSDEYMHTQKSFNELKNKCKSGDGAQECDCPGECYSAKTFCACY